MTGNDPNGATNGDIYIAISALRIEQAQRFDRIELIQNRQQEDIRLLQIASAELRGSTSVAVGLVRWIGFGGVLSLLAALLVIAGVVK